MFAGPGGAQPSKRLISSPAPWKDDGDGSSGLIEHHKMSSDTESSPSFAAERPLSERPESRPSFIADERAGSGLHAQDWDASASAAASAHGGSGAESVAAEGELPPDMPAPVALPRREHRSLCTICFGPAASALTDMCEECRDRAGGPSDEAAGTARVRRKPVRRKLSVLRLGLAAAVLGAVLVGAGMGVVRHLDELTPGGGLLKGVHLAAVEVQFAVPDMGATDFSTAFDVTLHRECRDSRLATSFSTVFELQQASRSLARVTLVETQDGVDLLNVRSESALEAQEGDYVTEDGGAQQVYAWDGQIEVSRVTASARGPLERVGGGRPEPARDVPPFLTFGTTGAPEGVLVPETSWEASVDLPCLVRLDGGLAAHAFSCRFEYAGRRVVDARKCAIVRVDAEPVSELGDRFRSLDTATGRVRGALAFDLETGLLVKADLTIETRVLRGVPEHLDESVDMRGTLTIERN
jgi:hypothetical protein